MSLSSAKLLPRLWPIIFLLPVWAGILFCEDSAVSAESSWGGLPRVSFEVKEMPLTVLIHEHLESTGYAINGCEKWDDLRVSLEIEGAPLDEALCTILKRAGIRSYVMRIDESEREITLRRLDKSRGTETPPSDVGEGALLSKEVQSESIPIPETKDVPQALSSDGVLDREITPPAEPGGRGITIRELQSEVMVPQDPMDREVTPSIKPGGRGMTLGELQNGPVVTQDPLDREVTPPGENGEGGLTLRDLMKGRQ